MIACKTVDEYKRNQEKIRKFCLEEPKILKATSNPQPVGEPNQHKPNTRNSHTRKKTTNWNPDKVRKVAAHNEKRQQQRSKTPITPKKSTNWLNHKGSRKRPRTPKKSPGELFEQCSKQVALQNCQKFLEDRSFVQMDLSAIPQTDNTVANDIDSDTDASQKS